MNIFLATSLVWIKNGSCQKSCVPNQPTNKLPNIQPEHATRTMHPLRCYLGTSTYTPSRTNHKIYFSDTRFTRSSSISSESIPRRNLKKQKNKNASSLSRCYLGYPATKRVDHLLRLLYLLLTPALAPTQLTPHNSDHMIKRCKRSFAVEEHQP